MATQSYQYTTPGTYTLAIPSNAKNVTYTIRGAKGGDANAGIYVDERKPLTASPYQTGAQGQMITGTFDATAVGGKTLTIYIGDDGKVATNNYGYDGGAAGGSGYYSGGSGGAAPGAETWVTAGGGSGGGGASAVVINGSLILCAGGGGGCGGSAVNYGGQASTYNTSLTTSTAGAGNGTTGGTGSSSANGGSGGGGGGVPQGYGGYAQLAGNHIPGAAGSGGGGYYNPAAVTTASVVASPSTNSTDGYFAISYESGDPPTVQFQSNPAVLISGQSATLSWQVTAAPGDEPTSIKLNGVTVPAIGTQIVSPTVSTDYTLVAIGPGGTTQDTIRVIVISPGSGGAGGTLVFTYGVGEHTINVPANTTNTYLTLAGGRGGSGGSDAGGGGCSGAGGRVGVFQILPSTQERTFNLYVGNQGNNGASGSPGNKSGGTGGLSSAGSGGAGGRDSLGGGWSGSGGGGGGATGVFDVGSNKWVANVGGGGGGGGGSWNVSCSNGASAGGGLTATAAVGAANGNGGANCGGDGGGGGGGGGGHSAGGGGGAGSDNSSGGSSGGGGGSAYDPNFFSLDSGNGTNNNNGYATLSFVIPPTISYFRANDDSPQTSIQEGDVVVLSWSTLFNGNETASAAEIDNGVGVVPVGQQFKTILSPMVTTTYTLTVSSGGTFAQKEVTVKVLPPDDVADQFSFDSVEDASLTTVYNSNTVTLTGLDIPVNAFCTNNAELSVNGGPFTTNTVTVNSGDTLQIRMESSDLYSTKKTSSVSVGVTNTTYNITTQQEPLNIPNAFDFEDVQDAPLSSYVLSNAITITGLNVVGSVSLPPNGGETSVNGGPFSATQKLINNGETLRLRVLTSGTLGDSISTGVSVGTGPFVPWTVTNVVIADDSPDFFDFQDKLNQTANTYVVSDPVTITGINVPTAVTVTNGEFRINGGSWVTSGNINKNDSLELRLLSSINPGGEVSTTVTVGNLPVSQLSDVWKVVTTTAGDIDPDAFTFVNKDNQPPNTLVYSNVVQIFGITSPSPISIVGGEIQINGGLWVTSGSINNGETLRLRILSSGSLNTPTSMSITVG